MWNTYCKSFDFSTRSTDVPTKDICEGRDIYSFIRYFRNFQLNFVKINLFYITIRY